LDHQCFILSLYKFQRVSEFCLNNANYCKRESYILKRVLSVVETLLNTLGARACSFARFLFFKGGNLFEIQEKLFVSLFVRKGETNQKEEPKIIANKKGGKKKGGAPSLGFGKELRLQLTETNEFAFLDTFSKKEKSKLFMRLIKGNFFVILHGNK